jgi:tRNA threonylcarbamoyladenosine biosynthesis protein TsaE
VLANFYAGSALTILHIDTYRLAHVREFRDLGLDEFMDECATLIEWGDLVAGEFPEHLRVRIDLPDDGDSRDFTFSSENPRWDGVIDRLRQDHLRAAS